MPSFSYWLCANRSLQDSLRTAVVDLADKHTAPVFEPHLTLIADLTATEQQAVEHAKSLAHQLQIMPIQLGEVTFSNTYFQCVFVRVCATALLMQSYEKACQLLNQPIGSFMPHISLLYGEFDLPLREKISQTIKLPQAAGTLDSLIVLQSGANPNSWKIIDKIPLDTGRFN